jgi:hypothetical protein
MAAAVSGRDLAASIRESAVRRAQMVKRFGFIPHSVLRDITRGALSNTMHLMQRERSETNGAQNSTAQKRAAERRAVGLMATASGKGAVRGSDNTALSIMPAELVAFFVKYYARAGDVYLDPFAGQGVQMQVAHRLGLHYFGYDLSAAHVAYIEAVRRRLDVGALQISVTHGDSRRPDAIATGVGDFCFTSPPYWDIEFYGSEPEQLGTGKTYDEFLQGMHDVARAWLPKFKPGAVAVVNVNDFRRGGRFYPYHADTIALFTRAGWEIADTWIVDGLIGGMSKAFAVNFNTKRIAPKVHEYCLVFRAPGGERSADGDDA